MPKLDRGEPPGAERIAKRIARSGLCSRREAERWIADGRVAVEGEVLSGPAVTVRADQLVTVDGEPLPEPERARLFRFHKPRHVLTTASDPQGRPTIYDRLPPGYPRLMPIGRLDLDSEGLLLLTNDGELKRRLELPATGWIRRYRVRVHGRVDEAGLAALKEGITADGVTYGPISATLDRVQGSNAWLTVSLREGKNREIRKALLSNGWLVSRLIRISFGPFHLGGLGPDQLEEVTGKVLKEQLGATLRSRGAPRHAGRSRAPGSPAAKGA